MSDDAPVQLSFEPQLSLKSSVSTLSISHLNIKQKSYNALTRAGVNTVSDLLRAVDAGITNIHSLGTTSKNDIERSLTAILASIEKGGTVNWSTYCEHANIGILPKECGGGSGAQNIVSQFSSIVKEILCHKSDDERWRIVQRWFGLDGTERLTFEALSKALGYSTSKIQNLRNSALTELREALFEGNYVGKLYRIHPEIISAIDFLFASLSLKDRDFILEADLISAFSSYLNTNLPKHQSSLFLLLTVAGMTRITFGDSNLAPVWEYAETGQRDLLISTLTHLDTLLTKDKAGPLDEFDILLSVNSRRLPSQKLTVLQLRKYLTLCSTIEKRDGNLYWGKFEFLRGRGNQVERVLLENDRQMRMPEIVREINRQLGSVDIVSAAKQAR